MTNSTFEPVYYHGNLGDLSNADWFCARTHVQLGSITGITDVEVSSHGEMTLRLHTNVSSVDYVVVRPPNTVKYVGTEHRKTLYAIELKETPRPECSSIQYSMSIIPHTDDGYGRRTVDGSKIREIAMQIDDLLLLRDRDPKQHIKRVIRDMGAKLGDDMAVRLLDDIESPTIDRINAREEREREENEIRSFVFEKADENLINEPTREQDQWSHILKAEHDRITEERTEGDDLMDFFRGT